VGRRWIPLARTATFADGTAGTIFVVVQPGILPADHFIAPIGSDVPSTTLIVASALPAIRQRRLALAAQEQ